MIAPNLGHHTIQTVTCIKTVEGKFCDKNILLTFRPKDAAKSDIVFCRKKSESYVPENTIPFVTDFNIESKLISSDNKRPEIPSCTYCRQVFQYGK
jgi:hypothetical protein